MGHGRWALTSVGHAARAAAFGAAAALDAWLNVSPPGGFHRCHDHGRAAFSGALYGAVPEAEARPDAALGPVHRSFSTAFSTPLLLYSLW